MHRRTFLSSVAAGVAAAPLATALEQGKPAMLPVIDTHQHLWDLKKFKLGWLKPGTALDASFTPTEYAEATKGLNVVKAVYMEVDVVVDQQQAEVDYLTELCKSGKTPTVAAVVSGRPGQPGFAAYVVPFKTNKYIKGLRQVLHVDSTPPGHCLEKKYVADVQFLGELGLSFDLCMRAKDLQDGAKLAQKCPDTRFILDHCGNPRFEFTDKDKEQWKADLKAVAEQPNVMCKISGFLANGWPKGKWKPADLTWVIDMTIGIFGVERCMYGGDWPVCTLAGTYADWLNALREVLSSRPEADQKKILHDNAARFYGI
jgi:predicted TIM-barrel fold metal-dependent hydrolase